MQSASAIANCPADTGVEIAFAGRSNAGKSSAINAITDNKKLARTSKTPGRTQLINFFALGDEAMRLVDLPGYGYAKVSMDLRSYWNTHLDEYLRCRLSLKALVLIMDIRKPLTDFDQSFLAWSKDTQMDTFILLTKADKLKFGAAKKTSLEIQKALKDHPHLRAIIRFSATQKSGVEEAREALLNHLLSNQSGISES